jgi:putative ABC transport system substrate-binding protein
LRVLSRRAFALSTVALAVGAGCGVVRSPWQPNAPVRIGLFGVSVRSDVEGDIRALIGRLDELGWRAGDNVVYEERWGNGQRDALPQLAQELTRLHPAAIVAGGNAGVQAARQATSTIPIVIAGMSADPVVLGLIESYARPGGNVTGISSLTPVLTTKRLEILQRVIPNLSRVAVIVTPDNPSKAQNLSELRAGADAVGVELQVLEVGVEDLPRAFEVARAGQAQALFFIGDAVLSTAVPRIVELADRVRLPAMYSGRDMVDGGGLMSYGTSASYFWRRAGDYVDKILRGASPAEMPVELPTTFSFVVRQDVMRSLGLTLPHDVALQVTEWLD